VVAPNLNTKLVPGRCARRDEQRARCEMSEMLGGAGDTSESGAFAGGRTGAIHHNHGQHVGIAMPPWERGVPPKSGFA